jgi:beta-lactam-binding protein with PASTA domain/serine/threonine protein kinase
MATIYLAIDLRLQRAVAVKVMHSTLAEDKNFITRFEREARAAAALTHPNVVSVHDQGRDEKTGAMYLVMELVAGYTVRDALLERGQLTAVQALAVLDPVLQALDAAHAAGFVHRDIKPENVMISDDGRIRVADFGLARAIVDTDSTALTRGVLIGTVAYLAPEQVEKGQADERSDIYSAGILLFEMLTGKVPFSGDSPIAVAFQHVHANMPVPSEVRPELSKLLDVIYSKATDRNPDARYQTAEEFLTAVRKVRDIIEGKADAREFTATTNAPVVAPTVSVPELTNPTTEIPFERPAPTTPISSDERVTEIIDLPEAERQARVSFGEKVAEVKAPLASPATDAPAAERTPKLTKRTVKALVWLLIVAIVGFAGYQYTNRVTVPQLVGKQVQQALSDLKAAQLNGIVAEEVYNDITAAGTVLSADPKSGESLSKNSSVNLVVSKGPEKSSVPSLVGLTRADAESAITAAQLIVGTVSEEYNSNVAAGAVISSDPIAGTSLTHDSSVSLVVSRGPQPISVPKVIGKTTSAAAKALRAAGFTSIAQELTYSTKIPKGVVISVTPKSGTSQFSDVAITLTVSNGPPPVTVPSVTGGTRAAALKKLANAGLKVSTTITGCAKNKKKIGDYVSEQSVKGGSSVPRGTTVKLSVDYICVRK